MFLSGPAGLPWCRGLPRGAGRGPCTQEGSKRNTFSHCPPCQLCRAPGESHPPLLPGIGQCLHAALGAPEGKPSPELLLPEKKRFISNHLEESPSKSKCAHSFQRGRNNSFIHTSSVYQLRIAEDNLTMPTLAAPIPLQLSLLQTEHWFTVHSWSN